MITKIRLIMAICFSQLMCTNAQSEVKAPDPAKEVKMDPTNHQAGLTEGSVPPNKKVVEPRVAPFWQSTMLSRLAVSGLNEAFGLFSEGGWSDAGQVIILASADRKQMTLIIGKPNQKEIALERSLTSEEISKLQKPLSDIDSLGDVDIPMFDGLIYEIVHAKNPTNTTADKRATVKPQVVTRVFYRNPGTRKTFPAHDSFIASFQILRP